MEEGVHHTSPKCGEAQKKKKRGAEQQQQQQQQQKKKTQSLGTDVAESAKGMRAERRKQTSSWSWCSAWREKVLSRTHSTSVFKPILMMPATECRVPPKARGWVSHVEDSQTMKFKNVVQ